MATRSVSVVGLESSLTGHKLHHSIAGLPLGKEDQPKQAYHKESSLNVIAIQQRYTHQLVIFALFLIDI